MTFLWLCAFYDDDKTQKLILVRTYLYIKMNIYHFSVISPNFYFIFSLHISQHIFISTMEPHPWLICSVHLNYYFHSCQNIHESDFVHSSVIFACATHLRCGNAHLMRRYLFWKLAFKVRFPNATIVCYIIIPIYNIRLISIYWTNRFIM